MGPDGAKALEPGQGLTGLGSKTAGDLIKNERLEFDGDTIKVYGDAVRVSEPWAEFDTTDGKNTGHFIPIKLPESLKGKTVKCKGRVAGDREIKIDDDCILVQRLENLKGLTLEIESEGQHVLTIDFTPLVPTGERAHDAGKTDFGGYGKWDEYTEGVSLSWSGIRAVATGTLKHYPGGTKNKTAGNYFPLALVDWFEGVDHKAYIKNDKTITEKDIIIKVEDVKQPIQVIYQGLKVMEIDITRLKLNAE